MPHPSWPWRTRILAHAEVWRIDTLFYVGLVALAGAQLSGPRQVDAWRLAGIWLVPTLGWIASLYGGDLFDRHLDAIAKPQRPIPSGRMSARSALAGMWAAIAIGAAIAIALKPLNIVLVIAAGILGVAYSKVLKGHGIFGNLVRGGPTALALLIGVVSAGAAVTPLLLAAGLVLWVHDSSSNLIGALCDMDGDAAGGYLTYPVRHGSAATVRVVIAFDLAWAAMAAGLPWWQPGLRPAPYEALLGPMVVVAGSSVRVLRRAAHPIARPDALGAHERVVIDRLFLPAALIAGRSGLGFALALLAAAVSATVIGQAVMRYRYEPARLRVSAWPGPSVRGARP